MATAAIFNPLARVPLPGDDTLRPEPTRWHQKPPGYRNGMQCPYCQAPCTCNGYHRRAREDERETADWWKLKKSDVGWIEVPVRRQKRGPKRPAAEWHHVGPTRKVRRLLVQACALLASGKSYDQIATEMGLDKHAIRNWKQDHPALWERAYATAIANEAELVRALVGSPGILEEADRFMARARRAEAYFRGRGETLLPPRAGMTLVQFFEQWYLPMRLSDASPVTVESYRLVLRSWALITGDPPLDQITQETLLLFRDFHARMAGLDRISRKSANTVHMLLRHLQTVLGKAGPPGHRNRDAAGLIAGPVPWIKPPRKVYTPRTIVSEETIQQVYLATVAAERPRGLAGIKPPAWWKALLVFVWNLGLRHRTVMSLKASAIDWQHKRLVVPGTTTKSGKWQWLPLADVVLDHLRAIRTDRELLFPWPHAKNQFWPELHKIQRAAGLRREQWFGLHGLRRTLATRLIAKGDLAAAQLLLGHAATAVTLNHYAQAESVIDAAVKKLDQPAAFAAANN